MSDLIRISRRRLLASGGKAAVFVAATGIAPQFIRPGRAFAADALAPGMIGGPTGFEGAERYQYGADTPEGRAIEAAKALKGAGKAPAKIVLGLSDGSIGQLTQPFPAGAPSIKELWEKETGIPIEIVAGTSAGSVVGALYASGMNALQINKIALDMDQASISDWALPFRSRGLLQGVALQNFLNKTLNNRPIEKMAKPLGIVATDLQSGQPILFQQGNTGLAVRASCSVPSVFEPVKIGNREYVDGGLVSPVPASFARKMGASFVIAVDISARPDGAATNNPIEMLLQTFTIMGQTIKTYELDKYADVVIRPNLAAMGGSDFNQRNAAILAGEEAVARIMPELQRKLAAARGVTAAAA